MAVIYSSRNFIFFAHDQMFITVDFANETMRSNTAGVCYYQQFA